MANTRKTTKLILDFMKQGILDSKDVAELCLGYMSEAEVDDMARSNGLITEEDEE